MTQGTDHSVSILCHKNQTAPQVFVEPFSGDSAGIRFFEFGPSLLVGNMLIYCDIAII